jgi:threonine aldolase
LAERLSRSSALSVDASAVRTNIVIAGINRAGFDSAKMTALLKEQGILVGTVDATTLRMLTHYDVSRAQIEKTAAAFAEILR